MVDKEFKQARQCGKTRMTTAKALGIPITIERVKIKDNDLKIRIDKQLKTFLDKKKMIPRESYKSVLKRLLWWQIRRMK